MSTLLNSPKLTDRPVQEPASDWASSTLDALGPVSQIQDRIASNPTTPGPHVPGAFPGPMHFKPGAIQQDAQYAKDAAIGALQTAKEFVPMSLEDVKHLLENAGDTVVGYLPVTVAAYLPHHARADSSLLSEPNSQNVPLTSSGGEGTLSGPIAYTTANTSIFSKGTSRNVHLDSSGGYPFEHDPTITSLTSEEISQNIPDEFGVTTLHGLNSENLRSETEIATSPEERRQQRLPDPPYATEKDESLSPGGVGILPEDEEVGLAVLPEERGSMSGENTDTNTSTNLLRSTSSTELDSLASKVRDQDISHNALPFTNSASLSSPPISTSNKSSTPSSSHAMTPNTTAITYPLASDGNKLKGALSDSELGGGSLSPTEKFSDKRRNLEQVQSKAAPRRRTIPVATSPHVRQAVRKRPGFMDRLKGEMKVISGKLSHKESKVEEGKRMIGKTSL